MAIWENGFEILQKKIFKKFPTEFLQNVIMLKTWQGEYT